MHISKNIYHHVLHWKYRIVPKRPWGLAKLINFAKKIKSWNVIAKEIGFSLKKLAIDVPIETIGNKFHSLLILSKINSQSTIDWFGDIKLLK